MVTVLVTDDDATSRDSMCKVLEREGYAVETAIDVDSALEAIDRRRFNLIVCDYRMPRRTGIDLLQEMRRRGDDTPFLIVSAFADDAVAAQAHELGATLLRKPLRRAELVLGAARFAGG